MRDRSMSEAPANDSIHRRRPIGVEILPDGTVHARVWAPYARERGIAAILEGGQTVALTLSAN